MTQEKPFVFDKPEIRTQNFSVSFPNKNYRIIVERKEVIRRPHNMGCTDDLPDDYIESRISYDCWAEVSMQDKQDAIEAVNKELEKYKT